MCVYHVLYVQSTKVSQKEINVDYCLSTCKPSKHVGILQTSPSQSHLGKERRYPHVGECVLSLRVLAVQCATLLNCYRTLRNVTDKIRNRCRKYRFCLSL